MRDVFIILHAAGGVIAFVAGLASLRPKLGAPHTRSAYAAFAAGLGFMIAALLPAIALDWPGLGRGIRVTFVALFVLALYMGERAWRAGAVLYRGRLPGREHGFFEDVGFNLIGLFDGFVIVSGLDLGAPLWLVLAIAVGSVFAGQRLLHETEEHIAPPRWRQLTPRPPTGV